MSIKIEDLNYCRTAIEEDFRISGGSSYIIGLRLRRLRLFWLYPPKPVSSDNLDDLNGFEQTEINTNSNSTIERLSNPTTGESGYQITSENGNASSILLFGPNSRRSFSIAMA